MDGAKPAMEKCYGVSMAGRTTALQAPAPPARVRPRWTTRATPGSLCPQAPAPRSRPPGAWARSPHQGLTHGPRTVSPLAWASSPSTTTRCWAAPPRPVVGGAPRELPGRRRPAPGLARGHSRAPSGILHGVSLSLAADAARRGPLARLAAWQGAWSPPWCPEHLAWSTWRG